MIPDSFKQRKLPRYNNAAGRLKQFLEVLRAQPDGNSYYICLLRAAYSNAEISGGQLDTETWRLWSELLLSLHDLVNEIEAGVAAEFPEDVELYAEIFPVLRKLFTPIDINQALSGFLPLIEKTMNGLGHAAKDLPSEEEQRLDDLQQIYQSVVDLFNEIQQSDLKSQLKKWILGLLDKILRAINQYQISGAKGLRKALVELVGELTIEPERTTELQPATFEKVKSVVRGIRSWVTAAERVKTSVELLIVALDQVRNLPSA